jgi:hypothetical protein
LGRAAGAAHDGAAFFDDVAWIGLAVLLGLEAAAWIVVTLERFGIALLARGGAAAATEDTVKEAHGWSLGCAGSVRAAEPEPHPGAAVLGPLGADAAPVRLGHLLDDREAEA